MTHCTFKPERPRGSPRTFDTQHPQTQRFRDTMEFNTLKALQFLHRPSQHNKTNKHYTRIKRKWNAALFEATQAGNNRKSAPPGLSVSALLTAINISDPCCIQQTQGCKVDGASPTTTSSGSAQRFSQLCKDWQLVMTARQRCLDMITCCIWWGRS